MGGLALVAFRQRKVDRVRQKAGSVSEECSKQNTSTTGLNVQRNDKYRHCRSWYGSVGAYMSVSRPHADPSI